MANLDAEAAARHVLSWLKLSSVSIRDVSGPYKFFWLARRCSAGPSPFLSPFILLQPLLIVPLPPPPHPLPLSPPHRCYCPSMSLLRHICCRDTTQFAHVSTGQTVLLILFIFFFPCCCCFSVFCFSGVAHSGRLTFLRGALESPAFF